MAITINPNDYVANADGSHQFAYPAGDAPVSGYVFKTNFEGYGDLTAPSAITINNTQGMAWTSEAGVRSVSLDGAGAPSFPSLTSSPVNTKIGASVLDPALTGATNSILRFLYAGSPAGTDAMAEQRFELDPAQLGGRAGLTEIWVQYDLYIPVNFKYRIESGSNTYRGGEKVFVLFADDYSNFNPTLIIGRLSKAADLGGAAEDTGYPDYTYTTPDGVGGKKYFQPIDGDAYRATTPPLIDPAVDIGHWQRRTLHVKMPTSELSNDGIIEYWIERQLELGGGAADKIIDRQDGSFYGHSQNYINKGYLLGYSNTGFDVDTSFGFTNFILAESQNEIDATNIGGA